MLLDGLLRHRRLGHLGPALLDQLLGLGHHGLLLLDVELGLGLFVLEPILEAVHLLEAADAAALLRHLVQEGLHLGLALRLAALERRP